MSERFRYEPYLDVIEQGECVSAASVFPEIVRFQGRLIENHGQWFASRENAVAHRISEILGNVDYVLSLLSKNAGDNQKDSLINKVVHLIDELKIRTERRVFEQSTNLAVLTS